MNNAHEIIDTAINNIDRLRKQIRRSTTKQVNSIDEKSTIKATGFAWFNNYRGAVNPFLDNEKLNKIDQLYQDIIACSDRATSRTKFLDFFKSIKSELSKIRILLLSPQEVTTNTTDKIPDFSNLISDPRMREILEHRWIECTNCLKANAPLAATVMMGGLLEALLLARINKEPDKKQIYSSSKAPKDKKTSKTKPLSEWTLRDYIDVAHNLEWISTPLKNISETVRDYRNYIHPQKELSHGIILKISDAKLFWEISKNIARQILLVKKETIALSNEP